MSQMGFATILAAVTTRCKRTGNSAIITENIQLAVTKLSNRYNFPRLQITDTVSTTASAETTTLPVTLKELYDERSVTFHVEDYKEHIDIMSPGEFFDRYPKPDEDSEDIPQQAAIFNRDLLWYPIPDDVYVIRLRFYRFHPDFNADTSPTNNTEHLLGEEADRAIIAEATAMTYEAFSEIEYAAYWYGIGSAHMNDIISNEISGIAVSRSNSMYVNTSSRSATPDRTDYGRIK